MQRKIDQTRKSILESYNLQSFINGLNKKEPILKNKIIEVFYDIVDIILPGFFLSGKNGIGKKNGFWLKKKIDKIYSDLSKEITKSCQYESGEEGCKDCKNRNCSKVGERIVADFLKEVPEIRKKVELDLIAAYEGDPAAKSLEEIILSYPGFFAIMTYRIAHFFYDQDVHLIPRILTEYAHSITGCDIHPGAVIGESFFIDHATGVVIGETTVIGKNVKIYQGVTLGALSFPKDEKGKLIRGKKRHPTIEDNVVIYANATILGGDTVIGKGSVIGGNSWITSSVEGKGGR